MAATQRARNKNGTIFRCSNAYAFLGGNKAFNGSCWLFIWKKMSFWVFCGITSKHIKFSKDISTEWCPIAGFAEANSISTTGWQSAQYVAFSCLSLVYFGLLEDFKHDLDKKKSKHFDRSLFFGSSSFCLSFQKMFLSRTLLMITLGYFFPLVFAMGCQLKKIPKTIHTKKGKIGVNQLSSMTLQTISVCSTWSPWLKGLVHWETCWREKGKNSSSMSRQRWIQYVTQNLHALCIE